MTTLKEKHLLPGVPNTTRGEATHVSVSPNQASVTYASGRVAVVRSLTDVLSTRVFSAHTAPVTVSRFSPDGALIASADEGGTVRVWVPETGVQKTEFQASPAPIRQLAFSLCGKYLVIAGESRAAYGKVLKIPSGGSAGVCKGHTKRAVTCDYSKSFIATGSEDMTIGIFKGPVVREFDTPVFLRHHSGFVNEVRFSPDGRLLAIASSDRSVSVLEMETMKVVTTLNGHGASVTGVVWIDDQKLLTSSNDKTTRVWSLPSGECLTKTEHGTEVADMQVGCGVSKQGHVVSVSLRSEVSITDPNETSVSRTFRGHSKQIVGLAIVGSQIYTADYSGLLVACDSTTGDAARFIGKGPATSVCAIAANEDVVVTVGLDGRIFVTPAKTLTYGKPITIKGGGVDIAVPEKTGNVAAVMVNETRFVGVNASNEAFAETSFDKGVTGTCVGITKDGTKMAIGVTVSGGSGEVRFFDIVGNGFSQSGEAIGMPSPPNRISFSPDGTTLAVGEKSRRVKLYHVGERRMLTGGGVFHTARVDAIVFSNDGKEVLSGGMDGSVALWPVNSEDDPVKVKTAHRNGVTGVGFSDAGLVTSGGDSCVRIWEIC